MTDTKPTLGSLINSPKTERPFDATGAGVALNTIKGIPRAFAEVIGQPALRSYAALGGALTGKPLTPSTLFQKELYGTDNNGLRELLKR